MNSILPVLQSAALSRASDIFLSAGKKPYIRVRGVIRPAGKGGPITAESIDAFRKTVIGDRGEPVYAATGSFDASWRLPDGGRIRVNFFQTIGGPSAAIRPILSGDDMDVAKLNLPPLLDKLGEAPRGLILIAGTTGSGKSTTLAAMINHINRVMQKHVLTLEDPIEFVYSDRKSVISQREIDTANQGGFSGALRSALRENPDVIVIGEMRDTETISAALTAAETGHLVFATIHTNSAPQTVDRIVDSFPMYQQNQIRLQLAGVLLAVISQRLIPTLDGDSRLAAFEIMIGTPPVKALIREGKTHQLQTVIETSQKDGMCTLDRSLSDLAADGLISPDEVRRFTADYKQIDSH